MDRASPVDACSSPRARSTRPDASVTVWGAVLGQPPLTAGDPRHPELGQAFASARSAVGCRTRAATRPSISPASRPQLSGSISTRWGGSSLVMLAAHPADVVLVRSGAVASDPRHQPRHARATRLRERPSARSPACWMRRHRSRGMWSAPTLSRRPSPWWKLFSALSSRASPGGVGSLRGVTQGGEDLASCPARSGATRRLSTRSFAVTISSSWSPRFALEVR